MAKSYDELKSERPLAPAGMKIDIPYYEKDKEYQAIVIYVSK